MAHYRRKLSDGSSLTAGFDLPQLLLGAAVGGAAMWIGTSILTPPSQPQNVGTQVNLLPNNPWAYVGSAIPLVLVWALFL